MVKKNHPFQSIPYRFNLPKIIYDTIKRRARRRSFVSALNRGTIERNKSAGNRDDTEREGNDVRGSEIAQPYLRGADRRISLHIQIIPVPYWYADGETCRVKLPPGTHCPLQFRPGPFQLRTLAPTHRIQSYRREPGSAFPPKNPPFPASIVRAAPRRIIMERRRGREREIGERFFQNALKNFGNG